MRISDWSSDVCSSDLKVYLADYDVTAEVTPTERAAQFPFPFPKGDAAHIILDALDGGSMVKVDAKNRRITGYVRNNHGGVPDNFHNYFVAEFDHDFTVTRTWDENWQLSAETTREAGHVGAVVSFRTAPGEQVHVKVASSFISPEQALLNLKREIGSDSFETSKAEAKATRETEFARILVNEHNQNKIGRERVGTP